MKKENVSLLVSLSETYIQQQIYKCKFICSHFSPQILNTKMESVSLIQQGNYVRVNVYVY